MRGLSPLRSSDDRCDAGRWNSGTLLDGGLAPAIMAIVDRGVSRRPELATALRAEVELNMGDRYPPVRIVFGDHGGARRGRTGRRPRPADQRRAARSGQSDGRAAGPRLAQPDRSRGRAALGMVALRPDTGGGKAAAAPALPRRDRGVRRARPQRLSRARLRLRFDTRPGPATGRRPATDHRETPPDAQDRDPVRRPHADRQARRRAGERRRDRARRHRDQGRARARRGRARPGPARRDGPGAPGRAGPDPLAPGADQGAGSPRRSPRRRSTRCAPRGSARPCLLDTAIRAGDLEVGVGGGMESMSKAPYLLKEARFGFRMGDAKAIDAMINDGLTNPFTGKHMAQEASEVGDELEMTRADMDRWALRSHQLRDQGDRRGPAARGDRAGDGQGQEGRHGRRGRRGAAARHDARDARQAAADLRQGRLAHRRQLAGRQRRRRRARARQRRVGQAQRPPRAGHDRRPGPGRRRLRVPGAHAGERGEEGAREGRA